VTGGVDVAARLRAARGGRAGRVRATLVLAARMMVHDKAKFVGTVLGVVFAVVLAAQQVGILLALLDKNTMFVDNAGADLWVTPPGAEQALPGPQMSTQLLYQARATPGVARASALVMSSASILKPGGGSVAMSLVGVDLETMLGGPWAIVAGAREDLRHVDTLFLETSQRAQFGGVNLGSVREVGGYKVRIGGFTWGLSPFGPPYAFAEIDTARTLGGVASDRLSFVLVDVADGADIGAVQRDLAARVPTADVLTAGQFHDAIVGALLRDQLGISFGTSTAFGLIIGFVIVALSMFSAVIDNLREFGTLKALGLTNADMTRILLAQSVLYALVGSLIGLGLVGFMADGIRSANLALITPPALILAAPPIMTVLCMLASLLALRRVRRLEPGMVFR
jgi:putative ABC transport system permease protein